MNYQYRKTRKHYKSFPKPETCDFCDNPSTKAKTTYETELSYVVPNRVFYDIWELHDVTNHLLVIPRRHVHSLSELKEAELTDIAKILAKYEREGYNVYARAKGNNLRSVYHQHTHLIKIGFKKPRATLFIRKPWLLIKF